MTVPPTLPARLAQGHGAARSGEGGAIAGNPILDAVARHDPRLAVALKVGVMLLVTAGMWRWRRRRAILILSLFALAFFSGVVALHWGTLHALGYL